MVIQMGLKYLESVVLEVLSEEEGGWLPGFDVEYWQPVLSRLSEQLSSLAL